MKANVTFHRIMCDRNVVVKLIAKVEANDEQEARELAMTDIQEELPRSCCVKDRNRPAHAETGRCSECWLRRN